MSLFQGQRGAANGLAPLNGSSLLEASYLAAGINANLLADGSVSNTEFQYLDGVTSNIQTQINNLVTGIVSYEAVAMAAVNVTISNPGTDVFDGVTVTSGQFIFLGINQSTAADRGLYVFNGPSSPLTRAPNYNTWNQVVGSRIFINTGGTDYANTIWNNTNQEGGTLGTTGITYVQSYNNCVAGTNITITGNVVATSLTPSFTSETLTANTNFLVAGTLNTLTFTMASLTASRVVTFPDAASNTVRPLGIRTANAFVTYIDATGTQSLAMAALDGLSDVTITTPVAANLLTFNGTVWVNVALSGGVTINSSGVATLGNSAVTGQVLTGYSSTTGTITSSDTILSAIGKLNGNIGAAAGTPVIQAAVSANATMATGSGNAPQFLNVITNNGVTITLPAANAVTPGIYYTVTSNNVTGTIVAAAGSDTISGLASVTLSGAYDSLSVWSNGVDQWFI